MPAAISRWNRGFGSNRPQASPLTARFAHIHLEIAEPDIGVAVAVIARLVVNLRPTLVVGTFRHRRPALAARFRGSAVDTGIRVRQGIEPGFSDLRVAEFTTAVNAFDNSLQGMLDLAEFAAFNLDQLGADFIVRGIHRGVDVITHHVERRRTVGNFRGRRSKLSRRASRRATNRE